MSTTIVMIHGMSVGGWCWDNFRQYFERKKYTCYAPTLRYHDVDPDIKPNPKLGTTSLVDYISDLENFICGLDEQPILIGHSMGGLLAQILAAKGLAKSLILLAPAPPQGIVSLEFSVIKSFWPGVKKYGFWRKAHRLSFEETVYSVLHMLSYVDQRKIYKKFVYESGRAASEIGLSLFDPQKISNVDETKVTCPVLIVTGANDRLTPKKLIYKIANKYNASSTFKIFNNHAHWIIGEPGWEDVAKYVYDWIDEIKKG